MLIVDNADDDIVLLERPQSGNAGVAVEKASRIETSASQQPLYTYIPQSDNGSVLVTSRNKSVVLQLVEETDIIAVKPMQERSALALLDKKLGETSDPEDGEKLIAALEFMPLAIVQAAAYIRQRAPRASVRQYLDRFERSDSDRANLLNFEASHLRRDSEARNSIITTWHISFSHIQQIRPSAADLLSLISFFDRQDIPEYLLKMREYDKSSQGI